MSAAIQQSLDQVTGAGGRGSRMAGRSGNKNASRSRKVTVIVPDAAVRVLLLDFDSLPSKAAEVVPILRFRLRKLVPFEVDDAAISYQVLDATREAGQESLVRVAVAVMPSAIREEYEDAVREAGYEPGSVLSSSLAALAALPNDGAVLLVNRNANSVTTAISKANDLLLFRTLDFPEPTPDAILDEGIDQHIGEDLATEELQQAVSVSVAYFEDMLQTPITQIYSVGPGGAAELSRLLADDTLSVRELVPLAAGRHFVCNNRYAGRSSGGACELRTDHHHPRCAQEETMQASSATSHPRRHVGVSPLAAVPAISFTTSCNRPACA